MMRIFSALPRISSDAKDSYMSIYLLAALMRAMQRTVSEKSVASAAAARQRLARALRQRAEDDPPAPSSSAF